MKRRKPLPRSTKPIKRVRRLPKASKPIRARKADPAKRRFAAFRDLEYVVWIRKQPCVLAGHSKGHGCVGRVQCCHVKARSTGGADRGNCYPACAKAHGSQHSLGIKSFQALYELDLEAVALAYQVVYEEKR